MDAIREVKCLQELSHPNIIALRTIYSSKDQNINIVLEYIALGDLEMLIKDPENITYNLADIKAWMGMIGRAVWFCHENFILHRDIKPNNLLIAADGNIKLADFGLARSFAEPTARMTYNVITSWYRPPELFFEARHYSGAVDVWSVGCVLAELALRAPYLHGETDLAVLSAINMVIGTPTEANWPGVTKLPRYVTLTPTTPLWPKSEIRNRFPSLGASGVDLLMQMLSLDPRKRPTAKGILEHEFFKVNPKPSRNEDLPRKGGGEEQVGEDLKRKGGELPTGRGDKVARKIDFGAMK
jgi:cyclin-dependent kinase 7